MLADCGHIVVVDDDPSLCQMVTRYLEDHNVPTKSASNKTELCRHFTETLPSLIILDLRLGQDDGLDLLREIRSHSDVPVIITTGHRPDEIDRIVGLELGADDYIVKPFSLRELLARVRAVLRRQEMGRAARTRDPERGGYRFEGWQLERRGRRLISKRRSGRCRGSICCKPPGFTKIFSIGASTSRSCGCGASSRSIPVRRGLSEPSAVSVMCSRCR